MSYIQPRGAILEVFLLFQTSVVDDFDLLFDSAGHYNQIDCYV